MPDWLMKESVCKTYWQYRTYASP